MEGFQCVAEGSFSRKIVTKLDDFLNDLAEELAPSPQFISHANRVMDNIFRKLQARLGFLHIFSQGRFQDLPRRGRQPSSGGTYIYFLPKFPKNCMKLRKFWSIGRGACAWSAWPWIRHCLHCLVCNIFIP